MNTATIFRADNYKNNFGDLVGFFTSKEDAFGYLDHIIPSNVGDGDFSQITEFTSNMPDDVEISDNKQMLDVWSNGEIVDTYFFV